MRINGKMMKPYCGVAVKKERVINVTIALSKALPLYRCNTRDTAQKITGYSAL